MSGSPHLLPGCPPSQPVLGSTCTPTTATQCAYGEECCCGQCSSSIVYTCMDRDTTWSAYATDFCEIQSCQEGNVAVIKTNWYNKYLSAGRPTPSVSQPQEDCVCIALFAPVCGVDGKTYSNSCLAGCAEVLVGCQGECPCDNTVI